MTETGLRMATRTARFTAWATCFAMTLAGCDGDLPREHQVTGGAADVGAALVDSHGCGACHLIPGIRMARGTVGPPLDGFARRAYIAGILPNRSTDLVRWLIDPPAIDPDTAMPDVGLSPDEARHVAAFLYTLR